MTAVRTPEEVERIPFPELKRFTLDELEIACGDAFLSGRVYQTGGEKDLPGVAHRKMIYGALQAVRRDRRQRNKR